MTDTPLSRFKRLPLSFKYIVVDCLYGNSPEFWAACEACVSTVAFVATPADTRCWLQPLATTTHTYTYKAHVQGL
jgi:hypothetical protein